MNWLKILVALAAFVVAGCAAYFSVTGLGILFSGASVAVMIMASALEFSKLVAASYLKQAWVKIGMVLKVYLVLAVGILMIITSAGIFGYLSNAFQQQNLKIQQVDREISVWNVKIESNKEQIEILNQQLTNLQQNQGKIIDLQQGNSANSRLLRSVDTRDKQISDASAKISVLQDQISLYNDTINKIKIQNIDIEREVGGFRFVAESFGMDLNTVVKFFIFLIVFVFDPLAIALVIAFNNMIKENSPKNTEKNENIRIYKLYGDEPITENVDLSEKDAEILTEAIETPPSPNDELKNAADEYKNVVEAQSEEKSDQTWLNSYNGQPYYTNPEFPWDKKHLWQNDQKAVNYWMNNKGMGTY
jgi:hypothetical protein